MNLTLRQTGVVQTEYALRQIGEVKVNNEDLVFLAVCQVLRDISCVNPSRTPKAFKGKGSAVNQGVNSGLLVLAGAGA